MKEEQALTFEHCYFIVRCLDMWGGDIEQISGFSCEDEAIITVKNKINQNINYCGVIHKEGDSSFSVYIKKKVQTNPSKNTGHWHLCKTIFYGKKITRWKECLTQQLPDKNATKLEYFLVEGLDMHLGSLQNKVAKTFFQAYNSLRINLQYNELLCGLIISQWQQNICTVNIKNPRICNPSSRKDTHSRCTTVFVGQQI